MPYHFTTPFPISQQIVAYNPLSYIHLFYKIIINKEIIN